MKAQTDFNTQCYTMVKRVPPGWVTTYKALAAAMNSTAWRAVGSAMANNRHLIEIPCHRVVRSDGSIGEYALGTDRKAALLQSEGISVKQGKVQHLSSVLYDFNA